MNLSQDVMVPTVSVANRLVSLWCDVSAGWDASHAEACWQYRFLVVSVRTDTGRVAGPGTWAG